MDLLTQRWEQVATMAGPFAYPLRSGMAFWMRPRASPASPFPSPKPSRHMYIGFSIGGVEWLGHDLVGAASQAEREDRLRRVGFEEARLTHAMGGNLLRVFYGVRSMLSPFAKGAELTTRACRGPTSRRGTRSPKRRSSRRAIAPWSS